MRILNFSEIYSMIRVIDVDKGVEQEMEETKQMYLLLVSGKFYFLIPLFCVKKVIAEEKAGEDMPLCFLSGNEDKKKRYIVILEADGIRMGLAADQVLGFREIEDCGAVRLDRPVINSRNEYLKAAALTKNEMEESVLAYIIDIGKLRTVEAGEKGEYGTYSHKGRG